MPATRTPTPLLDLPLRLNALLRRPEESSFIERLSALEQETVEQVDADPDRVLLMLIDRSSIDLQQYSATHAMLVMVLCHLARHRIADAEADPSHTALRLAALTMNISIINLQDELSQQIDPLSPEQKELVAEHPAQAESSLRSLGCTDALWLESVKRHHDAIPGALAGRQPAERIARLIQRADVFAARISPRKARPAMSAAAAAQITFMGEDGKPDEAGAALIKAVGVYPPGCWVGLGSGEMAIVLKRGAKAHCPLVAAFLDIHGMPLPTARLRDTEVDRYGIRASLPPSKIKFRPRLATLLNMI